MKNVTIYYVGGRFTDMVLEDSVCEKLCDWFEDDYDKTKMKVEINDVIKILNKELICQIDITKIRC